MPGGTDSSVADLLREESVANFYKAQRELQDNFVSEIEEVLKEEREYEKQLIQLKKIFNFVSDNMKKKTAETQSVTLCILSSVKFMISISHQVQEIIENNMLCIDYVDLLQWQAPRKIIEAIEDIESFISIYELFCNNPRGYSNPSVLFLFIDPLPSLAKTEEEARIESKGYTWLIHRVYDALARYNRFVKMLADLEGGSSSLIRDSSVVIAGINIHVQESRRELCLFLKKIEELRSWKNRPVELQVLSFEQHILHQGFVRLERKALNEKSIMYLFPEKVVLCREEDREYLVHFEISQLTWHDTGDLSFDLIVIEGSIKKTYHATCDNKEDKEEWMKQQTIITILSREMEDHSDSTIEIENRYLLPQGGWNCYTVLNAMMDPEEEIITPVTIRLTTYKNCFSGAAAVLWMTKHVTQNIEESLQIGQEWIRLRLITPLSKKDNFVDKKTSYYKLHYAKCLNCTNLYWPKEARSAVQVSIDLLSQVVRIFQDNRVMVSKYKIEGMNLMSLDPSYYEFHTNTAELQRVHLETLDEDEKFIFFVNVYNTLALHSYIAQHNNISHKGLSDLNCISFLSKNKYNIGGYTFSLYQIDHAILRANLSLPEVILSSTFIPKFKSSDPRAKFALQKGNNLVNFLLSVGAEESPPVIILRPNILAQQIKEHIELFCEKKVHVLIQGEKWKIRLPKILQWFYRDFGNSYRDIVTFLLPYLSPRIQETLSFIDNPAERISIRFDEFNWDFCYSISPQEEKRNKISLVSESMVDKVISDVQQYTWNVPVTSDNQIRVEDILTESSFAFMIPFQILFHLLPLRKRDLSEISCDSKFMGMWEKHVMMLQDAMRAYERQYMKTERYQGLSFRPSTYKDDSILACVAINLHNHVTAFQSNNESTPLYFTHSTFGAPAAHFYGFKEGGCRQLLETKQSLNESFKSSDQKQEELNYKIIHRLDICMCQILSGIVDAVNTQMKWANNPKQLFHQFEHCGIYVHLESLLSTISSEAGMLGDMEFAARFLHGRIFVEERSADWFINPVVEQIIDPKVALKPLEFLPQHQNIVLLKWGLSADYFEQLPQSLKDGKRVCISCAVTTQGINEQQTIAIYRNQTKLQENINKQHLPALEAYYESYREYVQQECVVSESEILEMDSTMQRIQNIIATSTNEKNTEILPLVADFVRRINGIRCTSCKSAKDRTSMAVTWEQGRWFATICPQMRDQIMKYVSFLRLHGVRKRNAFKNIGKQKFAFNDFQRKCLPGPYRAPRSITSNYGSG